MAFNINKIEELYPEAIMYEAMKIHPSTDSNLKYACESGDYFGQLKKDGAWYQYEKHENHSYLFGRSVSKKTGLLTEKIDNIPHITKAFETLPAHTILIGEIYYPGKSSKDTVSIMGCLPAKAIERQNGNYGYIHYYIHDILMYDNVDLVKNKVDNETRYEILKRIFEIHNFDQYDFLELAEAWEDDLYSRVGDALDSGEEGMVIKKKTGLYEPGKRPNTNLKAKKVDFADVIIIGFEEPTYIYNGKELPSWQYWINPDVDSENFKEAQRYEIGCHYDKHIQEEVCMFYAPVTKPFYMGWWNSRIKIGAINDKGEIEEIGTIHSGISDEMKQDMTEHPENYLGAVCSIQMMEVDKKEHTIRHGFFKHLRKDKSKSDCLVRDIF